MEFYTDILSLRGPSKLTFSFPLSKLPNSNDVYFRAKQKELVEQYDAARIFMHETETDDWNHWFEPVEDSTTTEALRLIFRSHFYETALFYYNAVIDISWTMCYVAIEYACSNKGARVSINGMKSIEEAAELLRKAEGNVTSPTAENNPFSYLKLMCPEFEPVIEQIISFWNSFSSSDIRKRYNYCKHKGRPSYEEIERLRSGCGIRFYRKKTDGQITQIPTDSQDIQYSFSLEAAIIELRDFDDQILFPYVQKLIRSIENILQPSPIVL